MTSKEAMVIGERLATQHKKDVLNLINMGSTPERALHGCIVSLAARIMFELQKAAKDFES